MEVTVYTTPTCPYCRQVKEYLGRQGVPYREVDVAADAAAAAEMVRLSGQEGVPVTVIDGQAILGYDRPKLDEALARARRPRLGAAVADAAAMAAQGRTAAAQGAYVGRVSPGGAAAQAGLRVGDVIVALGGRPVRSDVHLSQLLAGVQPGQRLAVTVLRDGREVQAALQF
jgi:glutaredoxin-like YruB-family protein